MGKSLSVIKSARQSENKREMNSLYKDKVKKTKKKIRKMIEKKEPIESVMEMSRTYSSALDKAEKKNILHKNTVARKKARMNQTIKNYSK